MNYETAQKLSEKDLKRLTVIKKPIFQRMLTVWQDYHISQSHAGRPSKLSRTDPLLVALQYWREYRTYFHIGCD